MSAIPIIFHVPHSSTSIPLDLRSDFCLSNQELDREILLMTDHYTDKLFAASAIDIDRIIKFPVSRLVVDPERFVNDIDEPMSNVGMGVIYVSRHNGQPLRSGSPERKNLLNRFYYPHHVQFEQAVSEHLSTYGKALIIDCHSYPSKSLPYEINKTGIRPDICIGTDDYHTPRWLRETALHEFSSEGYTVECDTPFSGTFVPNKFFKANASAMSIMIELRRDLYMDESTGSPNDGFDQIMKSISSAIHNIRNSSLITSMADSAPD